MQRSLPRLPPAKLPISVGEMPVDGTDRDWRIDRAGPRRADRRRLQSTPHRQTSLSLLPAQDRRVDGPAGSPSTRPALDPLAHFLSVARRPISRDP